MEEKVNIIDRHFARLVEQSAFELQLDGNNELCKDNKPWECRCVLPPPEEDVLLHLAMTGGLFEKSLSAILSNVQPIIHYEITDQRSNNERFLEELSTAAFVLASHAGGVGGVPFPRFLGEFLFDLGVSEQNEMVRLLQDVEKAGWTQTVPFLSPPNGK
ncbi:hypothetical protein P3T76_002610 [Phytophthora citrophthora]|uniref:Uncharacterized protein n=1 Tax=Phytophthora citrophthora TaxID=4793 RepID=A0AAD9LSI3_9STRA|nr:hypothetical protein P3T76_002610 [Phytophthora citrophthora]